MPPNVIILIIKGKGVRLHLITLLNPLDHLAKGTHIIKMIKICESAQCFSLNNHGHSGLNILIDQLPQPTLNLLRLLVPKDNLLHRAIEVC